MFSRNDKAGWDQSTAFKKAFSVDVEIEFVGVWYVRSSHNKSRWFRNTKPRYRDTVCSVGLTARTLPFTASNTAIRYFRHAISLDEHRAKFKANYFHLRHSDDHKGTKLGEMPRSNQRHPFYRRSHPNHNHKSKKQIEQGYDDGKWETDVQEVWFAGCHRGTSCL
jgi:Uncharacterized alpha/beta hydrolase domain (DUF2235)